MLFSVISVSYTHLDVYKRQEQTLRRNEITLLLFAVLTTIQPLDSRVQLSHFANARSIICAVTTFLFESKSIGKNSIFPLLVTNFSFVRLPTWIRCRLSTLMILILLCSGSQPFFFHGTLSFVARFPRHTNTRVNNNSPSHRCCLLYTSRCV